MPERWVKAINRDALKRKGRAVVRRGGKQVVLFDTAKGVFACNNRCPHEGYPLRDGTVDDHCVVTCHWHNWKFDLASGDNLYGGDRLRVYPVDLRDGEVWVDLGDPPFEARRAEIMASLRAAFDDHEYDRIAREIARLGRAGADPLEAVVAAIDWSHDRFEFGWTHAYAVIADWLALYDEHEGDDAARLVCLLESVGHVADDVLREKTFPYPPEPLPWDEDGFVAAIDAEDEAAVGMMRGALDAGFGFAKVERGLARAALAHYNDFGHSLIYTVKAGRLIARLGAGVAQPLLLSLVRSLVFAFREDHIPEFRGYTGALAAWSGKARRVAPEAAAFRGLNARQALRLTAAHGGAEPLVLYRALLGANAANMLAYDTSYQERTEGPIRDNVGWLSFTHGITFANAVRAVCEAYPELWPAGLLQMACFAGRNAAYTDESLDGARWRVAEPEAFFAESVAGLFDHGRDEYIVSAHFLKTLTAAREELRSGAAGEAAPDLVAALNRLIHSPLRFKHVRRTAEQALAFVRLDG
ncbi:MAG: Rieske 2Fe-2S domain-containing protein [Alphaproteobacteria bacterium]